MKYYIAPVTTNPRDGHPPERAGVQVPVHLRAAVDGRQHAHRDVEESATHARSKV